MRPVLGGVAVGVGAAHALVDFGEVVPFGRELPNNSMPSARNVAHAGRKALPRVHHPPRSSSVLADVRSPLNVVADSQDSMPHMCGGQDRSSKFALPPA